MSGAFPQHCVAPAAGNVPSRGWSRRKPFRLQPRPYADRAEPVRCVEHLISASPMRPRRNRVRENDRSKYLYDNPGSGITFPRPPCPFPEIARYIGNSGPRKAANWMCTIRNSLKIK
jgi:hypothetical protein